MFALLLNLQVLLEDSIGSKSNGIDADEALRIQGVVFQALAAVFDVHGGQVGTVEGAGRLTPSDDDVALVQSQLHRLTTELAKNKIIFD